MASKAEKNPAAAEKEEGKIPVLTVLKNNAILKNIFIVNKPPEHSARDHEDIFLVGRHPDCDLILTHPSISRFHLQICSKPSSQTLHVIDLSSVHGTWVSGRKIEPGVSVEMKEGDMLRIGVSSRVYRLHWIPISRAYDLENPFMSELDVVVEEEEDDEEEEEEVEEEKVQNLNCCPVDMEEIQSMDSILECINSLFLDENLELTEKKEILSAHLIPEDIISLYCEEERKSPSKEGTFGVSSDPFGTGTSYLPTTSNGENKQCDSLNHVLSPPYVESVVESNNQGQSLVEAVQDIGNKCAGRICPISLQIESENSSMIQEAVLNVTKDNQTLQLDMEILESCIEALENNSSICNIWSRRGKATSAPKVQTSKSILKSTANFDAEVAMNNKKDIINKTISKDLFSVLDGEEEEIFTPDKENFSPNTLQLWFMKNKGKLEEIKHFKSRRSHNSKDNLNLGIYPDESISLTLCKENQKDIINKTISKDLFTVLNGEEEEEEIFTPDKENFSPNTLQLRLMKKKGKAEEIECSKSHSSQNSKDNFGSSIYPDVNISLTLSKENQKDIINKTISKDLFSVLDGEEEEEIFTPDKEYFSPNTLQLRLLKKNGKEEEIEGSKSQWSQNSKDNFGPNPDESISPTSKKENQTPKAALDQKLQRKPFGSHIKLSREQDVMALKNRRERVPFQSLKNSRGMRRSGTSCPVSAAKSIDVTNYGQILDKRINCSDIERVQKKRWDMVVDTASLMNKDSRKALQLLQGLKGTRLIIPRFVIRELQSMNRQFTFFRRISEASLALEWIEECMLKTNWWIHIQSSVEEGRLIAPTPPASPQFQFSEDSWNYLGRIENSQALFPHNCSIEITSPTVEDHILDFALLYRRKQNDGQLVLLSEDVTLKIKCMAVGLLCEPVQEFRESLVNPFSGRFLWNNSSPRGQTWSCQDDVVLRGKYCRLPLRKSSKGVASGLKLILLHNSQYGH